MEYTKPKYFFFIILIIFLFSSTVLAHSAEGGKKIIHMSDIHMSDTGFEPEYQSLYREA